MRLAPQPWTGPELTHSPLAILLLGTLILVGGAALLLHTPKELPSLVRRAAIWVVVMNGVLTTVATIERGASSRVIVRALAIYVVLFFTLILAIDGLYLARARYIPAHISAAFAVLIVVTIVFASS